MPNTSQVSYTSTDVSLHTNRKVKAILWWFSSVDFSVPLWLGFLVTEKHKCRKLLSDFGLKMHGLRKTASHILCSTCGYPDIYWECPKDTAQLLKARSFTARD